MTRFGPVPLTPTAFLDRARVVHCSRASSVVDISSLLGITTAGLPQATYAASEMTDQHPDGSMHALAPRMVSGRKGDAQALAAALVLLSSVTIT